MSSSLINEVDENVESLQRLKLHAAATCSEDISDELAQAFWKLVLEGSACISYLRRICVDRQSRLSDESSWETESSFTSSTEQDGDFIPWLDDTPSVSRQPIYSGNSGMQPQSQLHPTARQNPSSSSSSSPSVSPQSSQSSFESVSSSTLMIEGANRPPADKEPAELGRPSLDEPIAVTQPLQPSDVALPTMALTVGDPDEQVNSPMPPNHGNLSSIGSISDQPWICDGDVENDNIMSAGGGSCAATIASLSDFPPELKINGKEELLPRPQAYQDTAWMKFAANNDQEQDKTERVPRAVPPQVSGRPSSDSSGKHPPSRPTASRRSSSQMTPIRCQEPLFTDDDDEMTDFVVPQLDEELDDDDASSSSSCGGVNQTSDSEEDDEDYEPTAPVRDSSSSSEGSSAEDSVNHQNTPLTRSEKRRRKAGYKKQTSPPKRRGHDAPRPRLSLVDQGIIIDSFNTELGDIYAVEVKPAAKTPRYIRWFDRKSSDPDLAGPAIAEMKRAEMPLHRKIFFLLEQRLPDRELPQAPLDLLAAAFGRAKLGDLESDAVIAWIATQDPAKMTHRVCAAAVIGCGGRRSPGHSPNFIIRLFTTSRDVSFGRRKVRVRGNGWGKLLLQEIEHHLVAARNCPYLLVESVAEAWGFWSHLGFELKSSRTTATSSSDTEGCEFDTMRIGVYAQTLIGAKPVRSFRRV